MGRPRRPPIVFLALLCLGLKVDWRIESGALSEPAYWRLEERNSAEVMLPMCEQGIRADIVGCSHYECTTTAKVRTRNLR
jgi:hypothetical protein